jgi:hypothetical protein
MYPFVLHSYIVLTYLTFVEPDEFLSPSLLFLWIGHEDIFVVCGGRTRLVSVLNYKQRFEFIFELTTVDVVIVQFLGKTLMSELLASI